jgi:hypothetical protein
VDKRKKIIMDEEIPKTKLKINMVTYRRLNIQHEINENLRKQSYLSNLHDHKYHEQLIYRKINHLRKSLEHIEPYIHHNINNERSLMTPNCSTRIQNHFRLLNFSSATEKRLSCQTPSNKLPNISQNRSAINHPFFRSESFEQKTIQSYFNQQLFDEQQKQIKINQRKNDLLEEMDELKHTINDPNSTFSVLAALSRALIFIDSATE